MAKKIIILNKLPNDNFRAAFWLDVPTARQEFYADSSIISQYKDISAGELTALRNGSVTEQVEQFGNDVTGSLAAVKTFLISEFNSRQTDVSDLNHWDKYGSFYDGTSWTAGGVV